jgi:hypothetical protein
MLRRFLALGFVLSIAASAAGPIAAAEAPKPLRTIVYDVAYSTSRLRREHTSGFTAMSGSVSGSGIVDRRYDSDDTGTLTVSIVAATQDGGLVADVSFAGKNLNQSLVRVAILENGQLLFDPQHALSKPALGLLPFLARGFVAERDVNPDSTWTIPARLPATGGTTYTVVALDRDVATIDVKSAFAVRGADSFNESLFGRAVYATDTLSPIALDLHSTTRRDISVDETDTIDTHLVAKLHSDAFPQGPGR